MDLKSRVKSIKRLATNEQVSEGELGKNGIIQ